MLDLDYFVSKMYTKYDKTYICIFQAHGSKGVMSMIANAKVDQLISAGKGKLT